MNNQLRSGLKLLLYLFTHPLMAMRRVVEGREKFASAPYALLARWGSDADLIIEAGAADGTDTLKLSLLFPQAEVVALEPVPSAFAACVRRCEALPNVSVRNCGLASRDGTLHLFVSTSKSGHSVTDSSSALAPTKHLLEFPEVEFTEAIDVPALNLDSVVAGEASANVIVLWLDLQGLELQVLGASKVGVRLAKVVYMEVCRKPLYLGAPTYKEVQRKMCDWGYREVSARVGRVSGNALFVRQ